MKMLTMREFYLHPKALKTFRKKRPSVMVTWLKAITKGIFHAPAVLVDRTREDTRTRIETVQARANFERGGIA